MTTVKTSHQHVNKDLRRNRAKSRLRTLNAPAEPLTPPAFLGGAETSLFTFTACHDLAEKLDKLAVATPSSTTTTKVAVRLVSLPPEILSRIVAELPPMPLTEKARLCLVCKTLLPIARGHLYKNNCFVPSLFGTFYSASRSFRPFGSGKGTTSTTQRSINFYKALRVKRLGDVNLGKICLDFSQPESAPSWPNFKLHDVSSVINDERITITGFWCLLPPLWIQPDFLQPFLRCTKAVEIVFQSSAIESNIDAEGHKLSFRPNIDSTRGKVERALHAQLENFICKRKQVMWPPQTGATTVSIIGEWETMVTALGACADRVIDVTLPCLSFQREGAYILWRCHNLQVLRLCEESYRAEKPAPFDQVTDLYQRTWASITIITLHLMLNGTTTPSMAVSYVDSVLRHVVGLRKVNMIWEKDNKALDKSTLATIDWAEIEAFCGGKSTQRQEAVKKLENKNCKLEVALVKSP